MKKITVLVLMLFTVLSFAQVSINIATPDPSAILDVTSSTAGFLPPRMTAVQRDAIPGPALGLMVFCTNCASGDGELQVYYTSGWKNIVGGETIDPPAPVIGDYRDGGIVFYIANEPTDLDGDGDLDTGLVCAIIDQGSIIEWILGGDTLTTENGSTLASIGHGQTNTTAMMSQVGYTGGAATVCDEYPTTVNGITYNDWFLPSKDELNQMYGHREAINSAATATGVGGAVFSYANNRYYWSSTEASSDSAWCQFFVTTTNNNQNQPEKDYNYHVRAVRAF